MVQANLALQLGSVFAILGIPVWLFVSRKLFKSYKESERQTTKYLSLALLFGALGVLFLALETVFLQIFDNGTLNGEAYRATEIFGGYDSGQFALLFAYTALFLSALATFYFDLFSLSFFDKKWARLLPILLAILLALYVLAFWFTPNEWQANEAGTDFDLIHFEYTYLLFVLFVIPLITPTLILAFSSIQVRSQSSYAFRRTLLIAFAQLLLTLGYLVEILGSEVFQTDFAITFGRFFIFIYPLVAYQGINPSDRIKRILGA